MVVSAAGTRVGSLIEQPAMGLHLSKTYLYRVAYKSHNLKSEYYFFLYIFLLEP